MKGRSSRKWVVCVYMLVLRECSISSACLLFTDSTCWRGEMLPVTAWLLVELGGPLMGCVRYSKSHFSLQSLDWIAASWGQWLCSEMGNIAWFGLSAPEAGSRSLSVTAWASPVEVILWLKTQGVVSDMQGFAALNTLNIRDYSWWRRLWEVAEKSWSMREDAGEAGHPYDLRHWL